MPLAYNRLAESSSVYRTSSTAFQVTTENLETYITQALPQKKIVIDSETIYVHDLTHLEHTEYNSLVLQHTGDLLKSTETTREVMKRYFDQNIPYLEMQYLGKVVNINSKCPYVMGSTIFVPEKGPSKQNVNWIALHHIKDYSTYENQTILSFVRNHEVIIDLQTKQVSNLFSQAVDLYFLEFQMYNEMKLLVNPINTFNENTFMYRKTKAGTSAIDKVNVLSLHTKMVYTLSFKILSLTIGVGDPYLEDFKEAYPFIYDDVNF